MIAPPAGILPQFSRQVSSTRLVAHSMCPARKQLLPAQLCREGQEPDSAAHVRGTKPTGLRNGLQQETEDRPALPHGSPTQPRRGHAGRRTPSEHADSEIQKSRGASLPCRLPTVCKQTHESPQKVRLRLTDYASNQRLVDASAEEYRDGGWLSWQALSGMRPAAPKRSARRREPAAAGRHPRGVWC